jgi:hypothetical protein
MTIHHRLPSLFTRGALSGAILGAFAGLAQPALAQTGAAPIAATKPPIKKPDAPPAESDIDATVTVTANRPTNRIDRRAR